MVSQIIEPYLKPYTDIMKVPANEVATDLVGMGAASIVDFLNNTFFTPLGAKLFGFIEGLAAHGLAGHFLGGRDALDVFRMGSWLMIHLVDPSPEDLVALGNSIAELKTAIQLGNWEGVARAIGLRTSGDVATDMGNISRAFGRVFGNMPVAPASQRLGIIPTVFPTSIPSLPGNGLKQSPIMASNVGLLTDGYARTPESVVEF